MLSAYPPLQTADGLFGNQLPVFDTSFPSWDNFDHFSYLTQLEPDFLSTEQVFTHSTSDNMKPNLEQVISEPISKKAKILISCSDIVESDKANEPVLSHSGSDNSNPKRKRTKNSSSNSDDVEPGPEGYLVIDDRKRRRMISNRESARRSRMRKHKHMENLRNQANRLRIENRELVNRLRVVTHHLQVVRTDNDLLQSESVMLHQRLWTAQQVLMVRELQNQIPPANIMTPINQQMLL